MERGLFDHADGLSVGDKNSACFVAYHRIRSRESCVFNGASVEAGATVAGEGGDVALGVDAADSTALCVCDEQIAVGHGEDTAWAEE